MHNRATTIGGFMVNAFMHTAALALPTDTSPFIRVCDDLVAQGWSAIPHFFSSDLINSLRSELMEHAEYNRLQAAHIGKGEQRALRSDIRGDETRWLNGESLAQRDFLAQLELLRHALNSQLFLGLNDLEAHFALYPPGTGYSQHIDSFQNNNLRRITIVAYLNEHWQPDEGGELLLFNDQNEIYQRILPEAGTLACFISEEIQHAVATTQRPRASIAGWFRVRDNLF